MFNPLGALGSFGSGAMEGFGTSMDLMDQYRTQKGQADFYQALQQSLGDVSSLGPLGTPEPGAPSARPTDAGGGPGSPVQTANLPPLPQKAPGVMPGAFPPMQAAMQPGAAAPAAGQPAAQRQPFQLAAARDPVRQELESTPGLLSQLDRITTAEVGRDPTMRQMFQETVINRAAANQLPLATVLSDRKYFPTATFLRAQREGGTGQGVSPQMWASTAPSNLTGYGTGNASIDPRTGRPVGFAGGPQTAYRGGEQYGIEGRNLPWARSMGYGGPAQTPLGRAGPQGPGGQAPVPPSVDTSMLGQAVRNLQTGNLLSLPQMAQLVERAHPNASPMEKFYAMKAGMKLLGGSGQMQLMSILQRQQQLDLSERRERREAEAQQFRMTGGEAAANTARMISNYQMAPVRDPKIMGQVYQLNPQFNAHQFANDQKMQQYSALAEPKAIQSAMQQEEKKFASIHGQALFLDKNYQNLLKLAERVNFTGIPSVDGMIKSVSTALGGTAALDLQTQLKSVMDEAARVLGGVTGQVLPENSRKDLENLRSGNVTFAQLKDIYERVIKPDITNRESAQRELMSTLRNQLKDATSTGPAKPEAVNKDQALSDARSAIAAGAPRDKVIEKLKEMGITEAP